MTISPTVAHLIGSGMVIGSAVALGITGHIDANATVALIAGAGGVSLGAGAVAIGSSGQSSPAPASGDKVSTPPPPTGG